MEYTITLITLTAGFMSVIAGIITIAWFIRDVRKQNSKVLKEQLVVLTKMEEGQRTGFALMQQSIQTMQDGIQKSVQIMLDSIQKSVQTMQDGIQKELCYIAELLAVKNK